MKARLALALALLLLLLCSCRTAPPPQAPSDTVDPSAHADGDDNGYCDDCGEYLIISLDLYAINDLHGVFDDTNSSEGVDELTTYLRRAASLSSRTLLLSSGDMWQGSS
ncbi:MAG: hypothetical protein IIU88_04175, partial [Clostridia bacterium]|nr:hypothetical protein [Clostridia bacterium]